MIKGIDVSSYQENINWGLVKSQIDFAILRCGYGDDYASQDDRYFIQNANACINLGIPFGVYLYSYAKRLNGEESIESEINHCKRLLSQISKKPFCVYIDMEDENYQYSLGKETLTNFALTFCREITNVGYKAGVYANENWFRNYLNAPQIASNGYSLWCARVSDTAPNIGADYDIWQYSFSGHINGITGDVDMDNMLHDIRGGDTPTPTPSNEVNIYYRVKTQKHGWLPEVKNLNDYAGYENSPIIGLAMRVDKGSVKYRVRTVSGKQLSFVTGYNINDYYNGWAGNNEPIDIVEAIYYTPQEIINTSGYKYLYYKVNNYPYQIDLSKGNGMDGYAGKKGVVATKFQAYIK